jgi:spermidine synthase
MRSFSYSFSLMLSLFLVGLTIGSASLALIAPRVRRPERLLAWLQIGSALYVASMPLWITTQLAPIPASSFGEFLFRGALRTAVLVLPPTIVSGMSLPLAARCFSRGEGKVATDVGVVYGVNTTGAILGAPLAGLLLLPMIGAPASLVVLAVCQALAGLAVFVSIAPRSGSVALAGLLTAACLLPVGFDRGRFVTAFLEASRNDRLGELLYFHEGVTDTVAVVRRDYGFHDPWAKSLITNGVAMSATVKPVWRYMAAEGHLPVLSARTPEKALLVGVGTGITLGAVASHPELRQIDVVELSRGVLGGLEQFEEENGGAYRDPRVRLLHDDGRRYLEMTRERYDVITLEPPPPIVAGSVHLYSLDFYRICIERLRAGGVVAQWLPLHAQSLESARMTAATFLEAFPNVTLWLPSIRDAVLIGSLEPAPLDPGRLDRAYANRRTRDNLDRAYLETPETLLGTFFLDRAGIEAWAGDAPLITDEHPLMEFFRHQGRTMGDAEIATLLLPEQGRLEDVVPLEGRERLLGAARQENAALRRYVRSGVEKDGRAGEDAIRLSSGTDFYRYRIGCAPEQIEYLRVTASAMPPAALAAHLDRCLAFSSR